VTLNSEGAGQTKHSERARQWVHIGSGLFSLLLRVLTWRQAAVLAASALVFNALVLPRTGGHRLYRSIDRARGFPIGILLYPLSVLGLILIFRSRLDIAGAAWAILAVGDGSATLVGTRVTSAPLPWNVEKTVAGTAAFCVGGALGGIGLAWWLAPTVATAPSLWFVGLAPVAAAIAAGLVESIPVRLDDNLSVPAAAGAVLWLSSLMRSTAAAESGEILRATLPWAVGVNVVVAWLGYRAASVTRSGMVGGALIGAAIYACGGPAAWTLLFVTFLAASAASRLGLKRKVLLGIAEERSGRRGAGNAFANCGVAVIAAIEAVTTPYRSAALLALAAALVAGGSDTVASEIGKAWGRGTFIVTGLGRVKPGTPGAISLEGTAAGLVAALGLAALASALGLAPRNTIPLLVVAAAAGAMVESVLGATLERPGILNNDVLNFINTAVAAAVALAVSGRPTG
jgi:uncharacterized protein (TIGR00297 family)